jgi:hypothetical protein
LTLSEKSRSINAGPAAECDGYLPNGGTKIVTTSPSWDGPGWYKFANPAGTRMATYKSPPPPNRCGTNATGFMNDSHPTKVGETKKVKFCFNWNIVGNGNTCQWHKYGQVTKCGEEDFVYYLEDVPNCTNRYCAVP